MEQSASDDRVAAMIAIASRNGSLAIEARPVDADNSFVAEPARIAFALWREGNDVVRVSLKDDRSGAVVYLQSGTPLLEFAERLGLRVDRPER